MKKIGLFFTMSLMTLTVFAQQFLWSTQQKNEGKQIPSHSVQHEVLKFYDHYKLYYDYTGYKKERFIEEIAEGFEGMEDLNEITDLTVYAAKSNTGYGSFIIVASIREKYVDMIVFANVPIEGDPSFQSTYDRDRFISWFYTIVPEAGDISGVKHSNGNAFYPGVSEYGINESGHTGDAEGTVDDRGIYGKSGGSKGEPSLDLAGWRWDSEPRPDDYSSENGRIIFEIKVDDNGEVVGVRTIETTVSATLVQLYRSKVERLTFSPLSSNTIPAAVSTGKITFVIRSR